MNTSRLMIGNLISTHDHGLGIISEIRNGWVFTRIPEGWASESDRIKSVPITGDRLLNMGFMEYKDEEGEILNGYGFTADDIWDSCNRVWMKPKIQLINIQDGLWEIRITDEEGLIISKNISYIHQLQNLVSVVLEITLQYHII